MFHLSTPTEKLIFLLLSMLTLIRLISFGTMFTDQWCVNGDLGQLLAKQHRWSSFKVLWLLWCVCSDNIATAHLPPCKDGGVGLGRAGLYPLPAKVAFASHMGMTAYACGFVCVSYGSSWVVIIEMAACASKWEGGEIGDGQCLISVIRKYVMCIY